MGTTAHGLPYPEPTDPVANGADAIRALAEAIDPNVLAGTLVTTATTGATNGIGNTSSQLAGLSLNFTPRANHRYLIVAQFDLTKSVDVGEVFPALYLNTPGATLLRQTTESTFAQGQYLSSILYHVWTAPTAATVAITGQIHCNRGLVDVRAANMFALAV